MTAPDLACVSSVVTNPDSPNIFLGLTNGTDYNASDVSEPLSISYSPGIDYPPGGTLFVPGGTLVTFNVTDAEGNTATCNVTIENICKNPLDVYAFINVLKTLVHT